MNKLTLDGIFADGMVLQRDRENRVWGRCPEDAQITAALDGAPCSVETEGGRFAATLPPCAASAGHTLEVSCADERVTLSDVCFGEVFLLSGQSNMQLPVNRVLDRHGDDVRAADYPLVRHFTVQPRYYFGKKADDIPAGEWHKAVWPESLDFSAAGFFFGIEMHKALGVPVGLVLNAMGGATIEAWMPEELLAKYGDYAESIKKYYPDGACEAEVREGEQRDIAWRTMLAESDAAVRTDIIPEDAAPFAVPGMSFGGELDGYIGSVYFYKEIELEKEPQGEGLLYIGNIIESDIAYVNGVRVGEVGYRYPPRKYTVPAGVLKKGKNIICSRILFNAGVGGFVDGHPYFLDSGSERVDISGEWRMKRGTAAEGIEPGLFPPVLPTGLYNASLWPLRGIGFAGLAWYQGESNANDLTTSARYDEKFADMVADWRAQLGCEMPVVCVEMCDFDDPGAQHQDKAGWYDVQRQQREAAERVPRCAVAIGHDLAEPLELHPQRKKEMGERMAAAMMKVFDA